MTSIFGMKTEKVDPERPLLEPEKLFIPTDRLFAAFNNYAQVNLRAIADDNSQRNLACSDSP